MTKLLIVDDEPLVQVGIRSMLNWQDFDIEICGVAKDGVQALELIEKHYPEIVITDIKMPTMNGLELVKTCRERYGKFPAFIILTSYEEFQLLKEAMNYQVVEYLVKLELDQEILETAIRKALLTVAELDGNRPSYSTSSVAGMQSFYDKFFIKLLHNLFENEEQYSLQVKELNLDFHASAYAVSHCEIVELNTNTLDKEKLLNLYTSTVQMVREISVKYISCYVVSLDMKHFSIIFCLESDQAENYKEIILTMLNKIFMMVHNYFNVTILASVGRICTNPLLISEVYQDARQIFTYITPEKPVVFFEELQSDKSVKNVFNMALFKDDITKAFEEFDTGTLTLIFNQIADIFHSHPAHYLQSIDAASNILYLAISLLPDGEDIVTAIFSDNPDGYRGIYKQVTIDQVIDWLMVLRDGLCKILIERRKAYKNHIVASVQKYIGLHVDEKLTLNKVAAVFGISPNYLSLLFKKYCDVGFSEYISQMKIAKAKVLLTEKNMKIYEIADQLGFESAFYFSKVFKKVEGCSPRDYIQNKIII